MKLAFLNKNTSYQTLKSLSKTFSDNSNHLKDLIKDKNRLKLFSIQENGFFFDFSKQKIDQDVKTGLIALAKETNVKQLFNQMVSGEPVNNTENRAALHIAARDFSNSDVYINNDNVSVSLKQVRSQIESFTLKIHGKKIFSSSGKAFTDAVIVGIGGSYLGCEFVYQALKHYAEPKINLHFLPNVDIDNFGQTIKAVDPETCLWIIISKSYTTTETMANLDQVLLFLKEKDVDPAQHLITVTAKGSPGDDPDNPVLASFHMFDFIGGRYSVSSAVGGLPLSLAFGYETFSAFLKGCHKMDIHAVNQPEEKNIPLMAALLSIWNSNFLNYPAQAIIPYASALSKLAPHVQQLYMESNGKSVTRENHVVDYPTGVIIFGEPGTNAQHSFFQLAHQGSVFPIEFIGVVNPVFSGEQTLTKGVTNHQELWANMIAQAKALAVGHEDANPAKSFSGNRPSSTIILNDLSPESIGLLLSYYEARTVFEGFLLGINPFDQFGVELGKILASAIRLEMEKKNRDTGHIFSDTDPATRFYLQTLFNGKL